MQQELHAGTVCDVIGIQQFARKLSVTVLHTDDITMILLSKDYVRLV